MMTSHEALSRFHSSICLFLLLLNPRQRNPDTQDDNQQREDDRLQHLDALGLRNGADGEGQDRRTAAAARRREPDGADVEVARQQLGHDDDDGREHGPQEHPDQADGHRRHDELRHQPEQKLAAYRDEEVDLVPCQQRRRNT